MQSGVIVVKDFCMAYPLKGSLFYVYKKPNPKQNKQTHLFFSVCLNSIFSLKKNRNVSIWNIKWWVCSSLAYYLNGQILSYNAERERAQDRATVQGSGFWSIKEWVMMTYIGCVEGGRGRERGREINQWGGGRDSFRISKCLLGSACAFSLGGKGKKQKQEGVDNIRKGGWWRAGKEHYKYIK